MRRQIVNESENEREKELSIKVGYVIGVVMIVGGLIGMMLMNMISSEPRALPAAVALGGFAMAGLIIVLGILHTEASHKEHAKALTRKLETVTRERDVLNAHLSNARACLRDCAAQAYNDREGAVRANGSGDAIACLTLALEDANIRIKDKNLSLAVIRRMAVHRLITTNAYNVFSLHPAAVKDVFQKDAVEILDDDTIDREFKKQLVKFVNRKLEGDDPVELGLTA